MTHPDPGVVEEANRNLRVLEQMRATLTDPAKRAGYDAGIGLGGAAGLADPTAVMRQAAPPPPRPKKATRESSDGAASGLWTCPKCATDNPPQTKHCFKCGTQLVRDCPNCNQMASLVATGFCGNCGVSYDIGNRMAELRTEREAVKMQIGQVQTSIDQTTASLKRLAKPQQKIVVGRVLLAVLIGLTISWLLGLFGWQFGSTLLFALGFGVIAAVHTLIRYRQSKSAYDKYTTRLQQDLATKQLELNRAGELLAAIESELELLERKLKQ